MHLDRIYCNGLQACCNFTIHISNARNSIILVANEDEKRVDRATYPLDVAISFWSKVRELAEAGTIVGIDKVKKELFDKNDELENWCFNNLPKEFFKDSSSALREYRQISAWAISRTDHYLPQASNEFLEADEADALLISYALADILNRVLITHEVSQPGKKKKIKIPKPVTYLA